MKYILFLLLFSLLNAQNCEKGVYDCNYEDRPVDEICVEYDSQLPKPDSLWGVMTFSALFAAAMAFGIGSNDAANSWGTSVGSEAIPLKYAVVVGGLFEWLGATTLGYGVSGTISKGVSDIDSPDCWKCGFCDSKMSLYESGMFSALVGASIFLLLASYSSVPVSTTHAIVGGVVGATIVGTTGSCLNWSMSDGLGGIIASWFISPIFSGFVAVTCYSSSKRFIINNEHAFRRSLLFLPFLYFGASCTVIFLCLMKAKGLHDTISLPLKFLIAFFLACIIGVLTYFFIVPRITRSLHDISYDSLEEPENKAGGWDMGHVADDNKIHPDSPDAESAIKMSESISYSENQEEELKEEVSSTVNAMKTLKKMGYTDIQAQAVYTFRYLLVFNACLESFAHGSNDTANATGAFSAVYQTYSSGLRKCDDTDSPVWIMFCAGFFVFLGMVTFGKRVILTMGKELTAIDFHRGFWIEFGSTLSVILATLLGFPISTTHCQVGAICAVGFFEGGSENVAWHLIGKIALTWLITLPLAGGIGSFMTYCFNETL